MTILVGPEEKRFVVHKAIISEHSKFLRAACSKDFREGQEQIIRLPEVEVEPFSAYLQWAYRGDIITEFTEKLKEDTIEYERQIITLTRLYIAADFLGDCLLRNTVSDKTRELWAATNRGPSCEAVNSVYANTPENCKFRKLMLDWHIWTGVGEWYRGAQENMPKAFFVDLAIGLS